MKMRRLTLLAVKIFLVLATSGMVALFAFYFSVRSLIFGNEVTVPNLSGHDVTASRTLLEAAGLTLEVAGEEFDPGIPVGQVIRQTPRATSSTKTRRKVKVVISRGTEVLETPDFAGDSERKALLEVNRLGLRLGSVARVSAGDRPAERIIAQTPRAASPIFKGDRISLLISRGPREPVYVMPDLSGQSVDRVRRVLGGQGLTMGNARTEVSNAPEGTILRQFPLPGYPVSRNDAISVVVSRSPMV